MKSLAILMVCTAGCIAAVSAQEQHSHAAPEKLGKVTFPTSCAREVQPAFERAVALLHSFAYMAADQAFRQVANGDSSCAMAHWGIAMSHFHQLWEAPHDEDLRISVAEIARAQSPAAKSARERQFINATAVYYQDSDKLPHAARAKAYERAMAGVAKANLGDPEAQIFYALSLIATAPPTDQSHANQKRAAEILEPLYHKFPQHPGLAHYLIHAYDSTELAPRGVAAARAYATIAPSAPHALHMPSHIFTRLGYWNDSVVSNRAARAAAHSEKDMGEELHAMDYLTYAYLQLGREQEAKQMVDDAQAIGNITSAEFKISYAANAMPVRLAVERKRWDEAATLQTLAQSPPHVAAIVYWARAVALARGANPRVDESALKAIDDCLKSLQSAGNTYWAKQVEILATEAQAWSRHAQGQHDEAVRLMRSAADREDAIEKLPVTPGPIVPAREQLGDMLLEHEQPREALREYQTALRFAPRRRGALTGAVRAAELAGDTQAVALLRAQLNSKT